MAHGIIAAMVHVDPGDPHRRCLHLPDDAVRYPVEWRPTPEFRADDLDSWPQLEGRLEYVEGRIRYMPPCGGEQQEVASDVTVVLHAWVRDHPELVVGSNEAGMILGGEVRAADAAVWRRTGETPAGLRRTAPILAVEVAGRDEGEEELRDKARWYLDAGVEVVWIVLPPTRELIVLAAGVEHRVTRGQRAPAHPALPGLEPEVSALFWQIDRG
jgi:Uma2 family endonuclease